MEFTIIWNPKVLPQSIIHNAKAIYVGFLLIALLLVSNTSFAMNANLSSMSQSLKPNYRQAQKPTESKLIVNPILWEPPPVLALSPVQSKEAQLALDHLCLDILMQAYISLNPQPSKLQKTLSKQKLNLEDPEKIYKSYLDFREYYQVQINKNKSLIKKHEESKMQLQKYSGVSATNRIQELWQNPIQRTKPNINLGLCPNSQIYLQKGRISILNLGRPILGAINISNPKLAKIYALNTNPFEYQPEAIAIHGLESSGEADLSLVTEIGIEQFQIIANSKLIRDLDCNQTNNKLKSQTLIIDFFDSVFIGNQDFFSDHILGSNNNLIHLSHITNPEEFFKSFMISSKNQNGICDLIIPTTSQIYKLTIQIKENSNANINAINLNTLN